jgi:hypothetical protein
LQRKIWEVDIINYLKNPCKKKLINPIARICNPSQVALDLAWGGLKDAPVFNDANIPLTSEDRARIIARYNCESLGFTVNSGTPNEQNPLGETCN